MTFPDASQYSHDNPDRQKWLCLTPSLSSGTDVGAGAPRAGLSLIASEIPFNISAQTSLVGNPYTLTLAPMRRR